MRRLRAPAGFAVVAFALAICGAAAAQDMARDTAQTWDQLVAAAQKEGTVVVIGPAHPEIRRALPEAFKSRFGVTVEYIGGPGGIAASKIRAERAAGIYSADVALAAVQTLQTVFYAEKMLEPLRPLLILPEVTDRSKWKRGDLWFPDPEHEYVLRLFNSAAELFSINTRYVKPADMANARDLFLNPKFRGRIASHDPTVTGTGSAFAAVMYVQLGEDFVRKLYVDQKTAISRDERQLTDWLLRGTYPIVFGADDAQIESMRKEGMPVEAVYSIPGFSPLVLGGNGLIAVFNKAPHPNAAKLFVNWIASKDGLELYARTVKWATTRNDIDEASFLPPEVIPKPGVEYFDGYDWDFALNTKLKVRTWLKEELAR